MNRAVNKPSAYGRNVEYDRDFELRLYRFHVLATVAMAIVNGLEEDWVFCFIWLIAGMGWLFAARQRVRFLRFKREEARWMSARERMRQEWLRATKAVMN